MMNSRYSIKPFSAVDKYKCEMSALMFQKSGELMLDTEKFAELLMNSNTGQILYTHESPEMWYGPLYTLELVASDDGIVFPEGVPISCDLLGWIGYLYFYWCDAFGMSAKDIYKEASIQLLVDLYDGIHVMSHEDQIKNILECNEMSRSNEDIFTVRSRLFGE